MSAFQLLSSITAWASKFLPIFCGLTLLAAPGCSKDISLHVDEVEHWPGFMGPGGRSIAEGRRAPASWNYSNGTSKAWSISLAKHGYSSPIVWGDKVLVAQGDETGNELICLALASGRKLWSVELGRHVGITSEGLRLFSDAMYASSTPVTDGKHVYVFFSSGDIACVSMSGHVVWSRDVGFQTIVYGAASSPILCGGKLIVQLEVEDGSFLVALRLSDGEELWRSERPDISWSTPVLYDHDGRRELLCASVSALSGHSLEDGRQLWVVNDAMDGECGGSAAWEGSMIYVNSISRGLRAYRSGKTPEFVWAWEDGASEMASPLAYGGNVYVASQLGELACLDGTTGAVKWTVEATDQFFASPVCIDGKVYAVSRDGVVMRTNAGDDPGSVERFASADIVEAIPAFVDGSILIRSQNELICYRATAPPP